jgi:hypothetical protein
MTQPILVQTNSRATPVAHKPLPHPAPATAERGATQCLLGPIVLLRQTCTHGASGDFDFLVKRAVQRLGATVLARGKCPVQPKPFAHHWVCEVELDHKAEKLPLRKEESYVLEVVPGPPTLVRIRAPACCGALHALTTLQQLVTVQPEDGHSICWVEGPLRVEDRPRHAHRGVMIDTVHNFVSLPRLRQLINMMSYVKLNVLHWRVEAGGATRLSTSLKDQTMYHVQDLSAIITYGAHRGVDVMLEYDPSADKYLSRLTQLYVSVPYNLRLHHQDGSTPHPRYARMMAQVREAADMEDLRAQVMDSVANRFPQANTQEVTQHVMSFLHNFQEHSDKYSYFVFRTPGFRSLPPSLPHAVLECSEDEMMVGVPMVVVPRAWQVESGTTVESVLASPLPVRTDTHDVLGGEICFHDPWHPSITHLLCAAAHALWTADGPISANLGTLAEYMNRMWRPAALGHAMDVRDVELMSDYVEKAPLTRMGKKPDWLQPDLPVAGSA